MNKKITLYIRSVLTLILAILFVSFENVVGFRLLKLIVLFCGLILLPVIRYKIKSEKNVYWVLLDVVMLMFIGILSRYVINYYVYALYMLLLVEIGLFYDMRIGKYMMGLVILSTLYHYGVLLYYRYNWGTFSEIFFMILINVVIVLSLIMMRIYNNEKEKQKVLNQKLLETNEKLAALTRLEVKTNIAREIHDTFGHDMMALIMEIEMADVLVEKSPAQAKEMLKQAKSSARNGMRTIRKVVEMLRSESEDIITESLDDLIQNYAVRMGIDVIVDIEATIYQVSKKIHDVLYRIVQECLTNSIRHGEATEVTIQVNKRDTTIHFRIHDNGKGSEGIVEGYGLKGMKERIAELNGGVRFKNDNGFEVKGYIEVPND